MFQSLLDFFRPSGAPRRSPQRPKVVIPVVLKPGGLSRFGYHAENTDRSRHVALLRAVREEGYLPIIRRLNLIATFNRYKSPRFSRVFKKDQEWLSKRYKKEEVNRSSRVRSGRATRRTSQSPTMGGVRRGLGAARADPPATSQSRAPIPIRTLKREDAYDDYDEDDWENYEVDDTPWHGNEDDEEADAEKEWEDYDDEQEPSEVDTDEDEEYDYED